MKKRLAALTTVATRWPRAAVTAVAVVAALGAALTVFGPFDISTSRRNLLSADDPGQARLLAFFDAFGRPDTAVFVVAGGTPDDRRAVSAGLVERIGQLPGLEDRVMGRLDLRLIAEVLAVNHPRLLDGFGRLDTGGDRHGLPLLVHTLARRLLDNLDGVAADAGDVEELARFAPLVRALDARLRGDDTGSGLLGLADSNGLASNVALDDHGYLLAGTDHLLVAVFPDLDSDEGSVVSPLVDRVRAVRDAVLADVGAPGVTADLTGLPALATDELRVIGRGISVTSLVSMIGIVLLLFIAFRSLRLTIIALIPLGAGVFVTLGLVSLLYGGLNLITSSFVSVLMGLGIDIAVHLLYRYGEEQRAPGPRDDVGAMRRALVHAGPGVITGTATTALAFITVATADFTAFAELGVITSLGLLTMLACAFLLIPPLMRIGRHRGLAVAPEFPGGGPASALVTHRPWVVVGVGLALTVAAVAIFLPRGPGYTGRYFDFIPEHTESRTALDILERDKAMGPAIVNLVAHSFDEARALTTRLRAAPEVGEVQSPTDLLPPLDAARLSALRAGVATLGDDALQHLTDPAQPSSAKELRAAATALLDAFDEVAFALEQGGRSPEPARAASAALSELRKTLSTLDDAGAARLAATERDVLAVARRLVGTATAVAARGHYAAADLPPLFRNRMVSKNGTLLALHAFPSGDIWEDGFARRFVAAVDAIQPEASGLALDIVRHQDLIIAGFIESAGWAALAIALFLLLVFRNVWHAALAMLPLALGWVWMIGAMKPAGLQFDIANLVALPLLLGIGIDAGAHIVHRYRESAAEHGGKAQVSDLVRGTGAAVLVSSLTTIIGFAALTFGGYGAMRSLGLLLVIGIAFSFLASTLLLPAILVITRRAE